MPLAKQVRRVLPGCINLVYWVAGTHVHTTTICVACIKDCMRVLRYKSLLLGLCRGAKHVAVHLNAVIWFQECLAWVPRANTSRMRKGIFKRQFDHMDARWVCEIEYCDVRLWDPRENEIYTEKLPAS